MDNKIMLITGANSGIGKAAAVALAEMGAHVVMLCRDPQKGEKARQEVIRSSRNNRVDLMICDLASLESVRRFAAEFTSRYPRLDVLINNAGIYTSKRMETADGFEYQIGVNHLGPFLLTGLLLDLLKESAPSRIINLASAAHVGGRMNFDDLQLTQGFSSWKSYARSKLANVLFTYELARKLTGTGVTVNCVHPGFVHTRFAYNREKNRPNFMMFLLRPFMISPARGAETVIYLAASPEVENVTGKYFYKRRAKASSRVSYDLGDAERLWEVSTRLTGIDG
jgi:NAD(P)-dependent dehydrogenase (short-subunit alcohol dehydrogenase family)